MVFALAMEALFEMVCIPLQAKEVLWSFPHPKVVLQVVSVQQLPLQALAKLMKLHAFPNQYPLHQTKDWVEVAVVPLVMIEQVALPIE